MASAPQPADGHDEYRSTCQTERYKNQEGRATYRYRPGYERKRRGGGPIIIRVTKDRPLGCEHLTAGEVAYYFSASGPLSPNCTNIWCTSG